MDEAELWQAYRNMDVKEKGKLREPAQAVAAAKCILYRLGFKGEHMDMHPGQCNFCGVPLEKLVPRYEEWMQWSNLNDPENKHPTVVMFEQLPRDVQRQEVRKYQGYVKAIGDTPRRTDGDDPSAAAQVADDGGQAGGEGGSGDHQGPAQPRATGRTSNGVRSPEPKGRDPGTSWATGGKADG